MTALAPAKAQACEEGACFFAGPRLASVDSERSLLLGTLFSALLGTSVSIDVLDWNAVATGEVNLASYLNALALDLGVSSAETALITDATLIQIVDAAVVVAQADGNTALVNALNALNLEIPGLTQTIQLGDLLKLSFPQGALSDIDLNVLDLLTGAVQLYNYDNVLTTPSPVTLDGTALSTLGLAGTLDQVELYLQVVEPPIYSCGPVGTTFHTAAIRSKLNVDLVDITPDTTALESALALALPGSTVDATVTLAQMQLYAELARAEGSLSAVDALTDAITINATPGAVDLYLGEVSDALFFNRTHLIDPATDVQLGTVGTLRIEVDQPILAAIDVSTGIRAKGAGEGQAPFATNLAFTSPYPETQTASTSANFVNNLVTDLITNLELELSGGLGTLLDPLVNATILPAVKTLTQDSLSPVLETALTALVDPVLELLGVRLGEVDVSVLGRATTCTDGSVTLVLDAVPDGPTDFLLVATGSGVSDTSLDDDADPALSNEVTFSGLTSGNYSLELAPIIGWMVTALSCTESSGGSLSSLSYGPAGPFFISDRSVNIGLLANEALTCTFAVAPDTDGDLLPDSSDPNPNEIDPQGFIYDEVTGEIIPGGSISVVDSSGSSSNVNIAADGSTGEYQFFVTEAGSYTVSVTPPPGYAPSSVCDPQSGAYDATPTPDPNVIGSDDDVSGTSLADASCGANPYYYSFILNEGDALVINNNYPLVPAASVSKSFSPTEVSAATESTLSITIANTGTNAVDLTNLSLTDNLPPGLEVASTPNASTTCSGGSVSASAGGSSVVLSGASLNIGASCTVTVDVVSSAAGGYDNIIPAANLDNDQNVNANGDAAATLLVSPERDYGDAPTSYGDAHHLLFGSLSLYLGTTAPDDETSTQLGGDAGAGADGDDADGTDDEDGVSAFPTLFTTSASYTIPASSVSLSNGTGGSATLYAYIDFNADGDFGDAGESVSVNVANGASEPAADLTFSGFTAAASTGTTYARLRLSSDTGLTATGAASDGEVEDYALTIFNPSSYSCPTARADLWFANDESGSVSASEFLDALDFLYQISDSFIYDDVSGVKAGITGWASSINSEEVIIPITESFGDPDDSGLRSTTVVTDGDGRGVRELYDGKKSSTTGTRLDYATTYLANLIDENPNTHGRREEVPQVAVILTDASNAQLSNASSGGGSNWTAAAANLRAAGPDGTRIIVIVIEEAATAYNAGGTAKTTVDAVAGSEGLVLVAPTYSQAADATNGYVEDVTDAVCATVNTFYDKDYGDAPSSYGDASHIIPASPAIYLGTTAPDDETETQLGGDAGVGADGDDTSGSDDEDGVSFNSALYTPATSYTIPTSDISVTNTSGGPATLHAWLDFDRNGSFESDEYASATVSSGSSNPSSGLTWSGAAVSGMSAGITYARFRLTSDAGVTASTPGGLAGDGEVEDHALLIQDPPTVCDGSDINELSFRNPFLSSGAALQVNAVYRFNDVVPGLDALVTVNGFNNGAGLITIDDAVNGLPAAFQPHLDLPPTAVPDASADFNVQLVLSGSSILYALDRIFASGVDIDGDNGDIREYIELSGYSSFALESPSNLTYVPNPGTGYTGRFEATNATTQPGISADATENIARAVFERVSEFDYRIGAFNAGGSSNDRLNSLFLECAAFGDTEDHGDAPASYGDAVHEVSSSPTVYLGRVYPDVETEAQQGGDAGVGADGDDGDGTDDEDGVTLGGADFQNRTLTLGTNLTPDVSVVGSGFLNTWVDWNRDGDFADAGEQVATNVQDGDEDGTITLTLNVPATALPGLTYARFRWSTTSGLSSTGTASDGEVEDYVLVISPQFVSGTVFYDDGLGGGTPNDGLQNGGELGVADVTVTATDGSSSVSTVTDANGDYALTLPASFSGDVTVSHSLQPATGSSIGGVTNASCLAATYEDVDAAAQLIGDTDCSGTINGSETGFTPDTGYNDYDFGVVRSSRFIADQSGQTSSPGVIEYAHLYTPGTLGELRVTEEGGDYPYQLFADENCDGTYGTSEGPHTLPHSLTVGSSWPRLGDGRLQECSVKVRVLVPDGEVDGATDTATLSANLEWQTNTAVTDNRFVTDTTVVTEGGQLELIKEVRNVTENTPFGTTGTGKPGEVLEYRISYTNRGSDQITAVEFSDPVPYFTDVEPDQYGTSGEVELICPNASVVNLDTGTVSIVEVDIMSECDITQISAGEGGTVTYRVRIQ